MKYCQGPLCHTYKSKDRIRGIKGDKHYQTRKIGNISFGHKEFCTVRCQNDWWTKFGKMSVNHFGRTIEPKRTSASNAWYKDYDYRGFREEPDRHYFKNDLLGERIPITQEQYNDENFTSPTN